MRIDQLPVASAIGNTDTLPFNNDGLSKQISVGNLTNSIRDNVYGAPLTASTSSAMTDTSRVYVYTGTTGGGFTNGHWYYYNGSAWTNGGVYNSSAVQTDPTLTLAGVPADAKATGELKAVIDDKLVSFDVAIETFYPHSGGVGNIVTVEGTVDAPPAELIIYGKSVQSGTPTPSAPVNIVTAGSGGTITMVSTGADMDDDPDRLTSAIPTELYGLPGIPVMIGGNYTDTDGQMWICDTIDLEAGVYTQRCHVRTVTSVGHVETGAPNRPYFFIRYSDDSADINDGYIAGETEPPAAMADYLPRVPRGEWWTGTMDGITITSHGNVAIRLPGCTTKAQADAYLAEHPLAIVYAQAAPVVTQLTAAQIAALRSLRGRKGQTNLYSTDPAGPEISAELYIDIPTYIQSLLSQMDRGFDVTATNNGLDFTRIEG